MSRAPNLSHAVVDGWTINIANSDAAISAAIETASRGAGFTLFTLNLDHLVKLRDTASFRNAYHQATFVTADGMPVAALARAQDSRIVRTTGADLLIPLALAAAEAGLPVYLFGTSAEVLGEAGRRLSDNSEGRLDIAGSASPPPGFDPESAEADAYIDAIDASGARLCFVALGAPKQELFAARAVARGARCGFICIGASLDFIAGKQVRAPLLVQNAGAEWLWRLLSDPRRLAKRYALCAIHLIRIAVIEPLKRRIKPGSIY
ncbi:MAG: WecB/TagA/CpsF family glycosyltransferase [Hyphomicrobium sp.]|nr:WecB/TagA/CpsF family glycosyltransferase [Hyphomicrobium sp.]